MSVLAKWRWSVVVLTVSLFVGWGCGDGGGGTSTSTGCPSGQQDHDGDGTCAPTCATAALDCGEHGICDDTDGSASCQCDSNYGGVQCGSCAQGYQDDDGDGVCAPDCQTAAVDCGTHGSCSTADGQAACTCQSGYAGADCTACADGYQDNDSDGSCQPDCTAAAQSCQNGQCDDTSGAAVCVCLPKWDGAQCASCTTGYTLQGDGCVWSGGPADSGFQDANVWTDQYGAVCDPSGAGDSTPGRAAFTGQGRCDEAMTSQSFDMPDYERSEPLVAQFSVSGDFCSSCSEDSVWFGLNGSWQGAPISTLSDWVPVELCLGERAYGSSRTLSLATKRPDYCSPTSERGIYLDDLKFVPDTSGKCPAPGTAINGDFEDGATGWSLDQSYAVADVVSGAGTSSSHGLVLTENQVCSQASATGIISVPTNAQSAVKFDHNIPSGALLNVTVGRDQAFVIRGAGGWASKRLCVPASLRGMAFNISFAFDTGATGTCTDPYGPVSANIDNVTVVDDPDCASSNGLMDGGFETSGAAAWQFSYSSDSISPAVVNSAANAHSGFGALKLLAEANCTGAKVKQRIHVPAATDGQGAALTFWYRTVQQAADSTMLVYLDGGGRDTLTASSSWTKHTYCVPPALTRTPTMLTFGLSQAKTGSECYAPLPASEWRIDDVELTTDPSCGN